jgi:hypothetical protein
MTPISRAFCIVALLFGATACDTVYFETPTSATPTPAPDPSLFTSQVVRGGFATRAFSFATAGTIQVTLSQLTPSVVVGIGVGIPRPDGGACNLSRSVETMAGSGPHLSVAADSGTYCVKIYDVGQIEDSATFSVIVTHP